MINWHWPQWVVFVVLLVLVDGSFGRIKPLPLRYMVCGGIFVGIDTALRAGGFGK